MIGAYEEVPGAGEDGAAEVAGGGVGTGDGEGGAEGAGPAPEAGGVEEGGAGGVEEADIELGASGAFEGLDGVAHVDAGGACGDVEGQEAMRPRIGVGREPGACEYDVCRHRRSVRLLRIA